MRKCILTVMCKSDADYTKMVRLAYTVVQINNCVTPKTKDISKFDFEDTRTRSDVHTYVLSTIRSLIARLLRSTKKRRTDSDIIQ